MALVVTACAPTGGPTPSPTTAVTTDGDTALALLGLRPLDTYARTPLLDVGFESESEVAGWYVTPQTALTHHQLSDEVVHSGSSAHRAWVTGANLLNVEPDGPNHRGYPTMQLQKRPRGCVTPCLASSWVWSDIAVGSGQWFSIATLTSDTTDAWLPVQCVNVGSEGWLHSQHVPTTGLAQRTYQRTDLPFPQRRWVRVDIVVDYRPGGGAIAAYQDGVLVSAGPISGTDGNNASGVLNQVHFGMYAPPSIASGVIYNDDVSIAELR